MFTVQSYGGVVTPLLVDFKDLPYPPGNAVSTNSRYIHLMSNFSSIHFHAKRLYVLFAIVDTPFSYGRGLIVCSSLQEFSTTKESTLHVI